MLYNGGPLWTTVWTLIKPIGQWSEKDSWNLMPRNTPLPQLVQDLTEMKQKTGESVQDYFVRCNVIYDRIKEIKPPGLDNWRGPVPAGANQDTLVVGKNQGVKEMGLFFLHLLFVVGLREDIRIKTIEAADDNSRGCQDHSQKQGTFTQ